MRYQRALRRPTMELRPSAASRQLPHDAPVRLPSARRRLAALRPASCDSDVASICRSMRVRGHPKAKKYLNKPIPLVDKLQLVCCDDHATGEFVRTIFHLFGVPNPVFDTQPEGLDNMESDTIDDNDHQEQPRSSTINCNNRPPRASRTSNGDVAITDIAQSIGQIAASMKGMKKKNWKDKLTDFLETLRDYNVKDMNLLYVTLSNDRRLAEDF
ncbi:hypothetical protein J5N97_009677 [Dioscorea zingiberensis]|uniref:Uncharacterized protein n=1 Tax=Dioscorea zingiberensis TaxID=325984 RepID=A0A9D5HMX1_9LILI|nr:hypothetical protein J5N97_009677 [Dioscorea zingiberensis]